MLKRLLTRLIPIVFFITSPIFANDPYEDEIQNKLEVYSYAKKHMNLFLSGKIEFSKSFVYISEKTEDDLKNFYQTDFFINTMKDVKFNDMFITDSVFILSYREFITVSQMRDKYFNISSENDFIIILPFKKEYRGILPPAIILLYRKVGKEWKIADNLFNV